MLPAKVSTATVMLSSSLSSAIKTPTLWRVTDSGGSEPYDGAWKPPASIPAKLKADALRALPAAQAAIAPAPRRLVTEWLALLGVLVAGSHSADDAKAKIGAYVALLDHPALCFTSESLRAAGREFRWIPSFAELSAFLDALAKNARDAASRLEVLARLPEATAPQERPLTAEEREADRQRIDVIMGRIIANLSAPPPEPQPEQLL